MARGREHWRLEHHPRKNDRAEIRPDLLFRQILLENKQWNRFRKELIVSIMY
jgi:hypothetical protein